ncbi:hypothetical protein [Phycicoccus sp. Root101]|uniref:hypothetical protein n=1 Tax=Phycicoccus sp. Root101 TaxID=1736421 RepID=UPI000A9D1B18|nr:hypothetical protein [Phycicoccus sp. Root101]
MEVTDTHRATSGEIMEQLAREVSSSRRVARALDVHIGHYQHTGMLNPLLYGFWILPVLPGLENPPTIPGLEDLGGTPWAVEHMHDWAPPAEMTRLLEGDGIRLQSPNESSPDSPSVWACVLNNSIEAQVESTLVSLAMLIARQELVVKMREGEIITLPDRAGRVDEDTTKDIGDDVRLNGWRSAARAIRARAEAADCSLHVEYRAPLMEGETARDRMLLARHVYNTLPGARGTVDRVVEMLSQGWSITGAGDERSLQRGRDMLEGLGISYLLAHVSRDAMVCGVGALSLGNIPLEDPWLIRPEDISSVSDDGDSVFRRNGDSIERVQPVLALSGAAQVDSRVGLSLLEPLVVNAANRDLYLRILLSARVVQKVQQRLPDQVRQWAEETTPMATRQLTTLANTAEGTFNPAIFRLSKLPGMIYSEGHELMHPSAFRVTVGR